MKKVLLIGLVVISGLVLIGGKGGESTNPPSGEKEPARNEPANKETSPLEKEKSPAELKKEKAEWVDGLIKKLQDSDLWVRVEAIKKLGNADDPKAVAALRGALNDENVDINVEALRALKKSGDKDSLDLLLQAAVVYDLQSLRFYAVEAACAIDPAKTKRALQDNLRNVVSNTRVNAAEGLANLFTVTKQRDKETIQGMIDTLSREDKETEKNKIAEALKVMTDAKLNTADEKEWRKWCEANADKLEKKSEAPKKAVVTDEKPPTPEEQKKIAKKKEAEKKFEEFKDKAILEKKPGEKSASFYSTRSKEGKKAAIDAFAGKDERVIKIVDNALNWLHRHQDKDGFWDYNGYVKQCPIGGGQDNIGEIKGEYDVAMTGLALLAFLGAGHTHIPGQKVGLPAGGEYKPTVERGLRWLLAIQKPDGSFYNPHSTGTINMFEQAMATLAVSEAYGMTGDELLKKPAERALKFISQVKNPGKAWRYTPLCNDNDTSVSGWQVFALKSGKVTGLNIERDDLVDASKWLDEMTNMDSGRVGYNKKGEGSTTITSVGIICRMLVGWRSDSPLLAKGAELVLADKSYQDHKDFYHIYQTALAMFQMGGHYWDEWNKEMSDYLAENQVKEGCEHGSWPAGDEKWSKSRVYTTALGALALEVYYRYLPFAR